LSQWAVLAGGRVHQSQCAAMGCCIGRAAGRTRRNPDQPKESRGRAGARQDLGADPHRGRRRTRSASTCMSRG